MCKDQLKASHPRIHLDWEVARLLPSLQTFADICNKIEAERLSDEEVALEFSLVKRLNFC
jgi:hypothetical protein